MQGSRQLFKWYLPEIKGGDTLSSISLSNSSDKYWSAIKERILPLKIGPQVQLSNTFHGSNWSPKNVSSYEGLIYPTSSLFFLGNQETTLMKMQGIHQESVPWPQHAKRCQRNLQSHDLCYRHTECQICIWRSYRYYHQRKPQGLRALLILISLHVHIP